MNNQSKNKIFMLTIIALGLFCLSATIYRLPFEKIDGLFLILFAFTIGIGSQITIQIPRFKSHIAVSDTFIFLALFLYGGEIAIVLAALEAFFSSWRFCKKKITVFFNVASMGLSTIMVVLTLRGFGLNTENQLLENGEDFNTFFLTLAIIALVQFIANTTMTAIYGALKSEKPLWETWKNQYAWTFITYFVGAVGAGILVKAAYYIGFGAVVAVFPIIFFVYLSYKMYMKNVEMATVQAEQAGEHAKILEDQSAALRESEERFRSAFDYAPIGIGLVSIDGNWLKVNRALTEILGYTEAEFLETNFQSMLFSEDLGNTLVKIHELFLGKTSNCQIEQRFIHKSGATVWTAWSVSTASEAANKKHSSLIFQIQDVTDRVLAEQKLKHEATHDALTGLPNRPFFMTRLERAIETAKENPRHKISVMFIDLDRFKIVNDSLGHACGDRLLIGIANRMRECLRPHDFVARLGGDEFTILVEGSYESSEVVRIAERLQEKFAHPFDLDGHEIYSSASIGILNRSAQHLTPEDMMRDADTAMYRAKRAGKACHEVFSEEMHEDVKAAMQLETELRRALDNEELSVYYQPIYSIKTNKIQGFEALARWQHKTMGLITPDKFIGLAEEIGLIDQLGDQILRKACQQGLVLRQRFSEDEPFTLSVNLSCKQFAQMDLVETIHRILKDTGFPPQELKLEITESVFFEHREKAVEMLHKLRELGIEINIDDFGTGYSNLSYLMQLPISTLKIDRSFINPMDTPGRGIEIVQTILRLADSLGIRVIAEGVETESQLEQLRNLKCEGAQGFLFSKPMSFDDTNQYLSGDIAKNALVRSGEFKDVSILTTVQ